MTTRTLTGRDYLLTWIALLVLSGLTFLLSFLPLGPLHVPIALLIAAGKGALIVLVFMHLAEQPSGNRVILVFWLLLFAILVALTAADVATRHLTERPPVSG